MLISDPLQKVQKLMRKKRQKNGFFYFCYCVQKFSDYNFIWVKFFAFLSFLQKQIFVLF
jgi:hypothetical protein